MDISKGIPQAYVAQLASSASIIAKYMYDIDLGDVEVKVSFAKVAKKVGLDFCCSSGSSLMVVSPSRLVELLDPQDPLWEAIIGDLNSVKTRQA